MLFEDLLLLWQGEALVDDYTNRFHELSIRSQVSETECQSIARYKTGLWDDIWKDLLIVHPMIIEEAYQLAFCLEQQYRVSQKPMSNWTTPPLKWNPNQKNKVLNRTYLKQSFIDTRNREFRMWYEQKQAEGIL